MIVGRIENGAPAVIPDEVLAALGVTAGDDLVWEFEGNCVVLSRAGTIVDPFIGNFSAFTEWATEADCKAFDDL